MTTKFFVTGTDTNVGKTVATAFLVARALHLFADVGYHKPVQTGAETDSDATTITTLTSIVPTLVSTGIALNRPLSPHLSAFYAGRYLELAPIIRQAQASCAHACDFVEGAGGLFVPLNRRAFMIDLIEKLTIPCIVVTSAKLGCINHTLLSLAALRARRVPIHGVIMVGNRLRDSEDAIKFFGNVENILHVPQLSTLSRDELTQAAHRERDNIDRFLLRRD